MSHIEQLQDIANRQLGGLRATPKMLGEIKLAAARKRDKAAVRRVWRPALAVGAALLVCIGIYAQTGKERMPLSPVPSHTVLDSQTAGGGEQAAEPRRWIDRQHEVPERDPARRPVTRWASGSGATLHGSRPRGMRRGPRGPWPRPRRRARRSRGTPG